MVGKAWRSQNGLYNHEAKNEQKVGPGYETSSAPLPTHFLERGSTMAS